MKVLPATEINGEVYLRVEVLPDAFFKNEVKCVNFNGNKKALKGKVLYLKDTDRWATNEMPAAWRNQIEKKEDELNKEYDLKSSASGKKQLKDRLKSINAYFSKLDKYSHRALEHLERTMRWFRRTGDSARGAGNERSWPQLLSSSVHPLTWKMHREIFQMFTNYRSQLFNRMQNNMFEKIAQEFPEAFRMNMETANKIKISELVKKWIEMSIVRFFGRSQKDVALTKEAFIYTLKNLNSDEELGIDMPEEAMNHTAELYAKDAKHVIKLHTNQALGAICEGHNICA